MNALILMHQETEVGGYPFQAQKCQVTASRAGRGGTCSIARKVQEQVNVVQIVFAHAVIWDFPKINRIISMYFL